jgi:tRNA G18 (ribose-2'-O)-methylase SpoU
MHIYNHSEPEQLRTLKASAQGICQYPNQKLAFVLGNEIDGVQQEIVDISNICLEIPQFGTKHSFNVAVTCGMILWDYAKYAKG